MQIDLKDSYQTINFDVIKKFIAAIDLTNDQVCTIVDGPNQYISYFLLTGNYQCLSRSARKVLKGINFEDIFINVVGALLFYDSINDKEKPCIEKIYGNKYWEDLYFNTYNITNNKLFIEQYKNNFLNIINKNNFSYNNIIYWNLVEMLRIRETSDLQKMNENYLNVSEKICYLLENSIHINKIKTKKLFRK